MRIALAQINPIVGDLSGNAQKIIEAATRAKSQGARLLLTPELVLSGYSPEDLLLRDGFYRSCEETLNDLAAQIEDITVVVGHPAKDGSQRYNAASVIQNGAIIATYYKHHLPNYAVFDEVRHFTPGQDACTFELDGVTFGINICADIWNPEAPRKARQAGAEVLLVLNASPFYIEKQLRRYQIARDRVAETGLALVYCNTIGGQDELVFDGGSFVVDQTGDLVCQAPFFDESLILVDMNGPAPLPGQIVPLPIQEESVYRALMLGVRDYVTKNRFPGIELGLSGGIDSALVLAIAVDALGADRVHAVMMPSQYTADISVEDARKMAEQLGVRYSEIAIKPVFDRFLESLAPEFSGRQVDTTEENIQARIRGTLLMALSNKYGTLVLTTGNKSEMAVGYATLYGDMAGGFAVLKDVPKTLVYQLARYRNCQYAVIPERIITRPPSAELRPDQKDQDSLPAYDILDAIMERYVERDMCPAEIVADGYAEQDVRRVVRLIDINEYKRRQAPVGIRITHRAFGKDRRYPITSHYQPRF